MTAVVTKAYNDLLLAADGGQQATLCLLDPRAAVDNVNVMDSTDN